MTSAFLHASRPIVAVEVVVVVAVAVVIVAVEVDVCVAVVVVVLLPLKFWLDVVGVDTTPSLVAFLDA